MPFKTILAPTDFSEPCLNATDLAVEMAIKYESALVIVHTCELPSSSYPGMALDLVDLLSYIETAAKQALEKELVRVRAKWPRATGLLKTGVVWQEILAAIEATKADLVVMSTSGRHGVAHLLLGSVAEKIVRTSPVPVLTLRAAQYQARPKPALP